MRVLVCGGRDFQENYVLTRVLDTFDITVLIEGGATGADQLARAWALSNRVPNETYKANWARYGKAAGPLRNQRMLDEGKPDTVIAFPGGKGTADMVRRARKAGVPVHQIGATEMPDVFQFGTVLHRRS